MQKCHVYPVKHRSCEKPGFANFYIPHTVAIVPLGSNLSLAQFYETRLVQEPGAEKRKMPSGICDHPPTWSHALLCILAKGKRQLSRKRGASSPVPCCGSKFATCSLYLGNGCSANSSPIGPGEVMLFYKSARMWSCFDMFQWEIDKRIIILTPHQSKSMPQLFEVSSIFDPTHARPPASQRVPGWHCTQKTQQTKFR